MDSQGANKKRGGSGSDLKERLLRTKEEMERIRGELREAGAKVEEPTRREASLAERLSDPKESKASAGGGASLDGRELSPEQISRAEQALIVREKKEAIRLKNEHERLLMKMEEERHALWIKAMEDIFRDDEEGDEDERGVGECDDERSPCPQCRKPIGEKDFKCPHCGFFLGRRGRMEEGGLLKLEARLRQKTYRAGRAGVLEIQVVNASGGTLSDVGIQVSCEHFQKEVSPRELGSLAAGASQVVPLEFIPVRGLELLADIRLAYLGDNGAPCVLTGQTILYVEDSSPGEYKVVVNQSLEVPEGAEMMAADVRHHGQVVLNLNHPSLEEILPGSFQLNTWQPIPLAFDAEVSRILLDSQSPDKDDAPKDTEPSGEAAPLPELARFWFPVGEGRVKTVLVRLKGEMTFGAARDSDVWCVMPGEDGSLSRKSAFVSRRHLSLAPSDNVCVARDHSTVGTLVGGEKLHDSSTVLKDGQVLCLAGVFFITYREFRDWSDLKGEFGRGCFATSIIRAKEVASRHRKVERQRLPLNAVRIRRMDRYRDNLEYFLLLRELEIGSAPNNALVVPHPSVAELHARLVISERGLELVDLGSKQGIWLNDRRLKPHESALLKERGTMRLGTLEVKYKLMYEA